jgi:hypothetical protein
LSEPFGSGTNGNVEAKADIRTRPRRSDRWSAEPAEPSVNWWAILGVLVVVTAYGVAALVGAIVRGDVVFDDDVGLLFVGVAPSLAALGVVFGIVGARRYGLRWLAWVAIVLGTLLVGASVLVIGAVVIAFRNFS